MAAAAAAAATAGGGTSDFVSAQAQETALIGLAFLHRQLTHERVEPRAARAAIACLSHLQRFHRALSHPAVVASGATKQCLTAVLRCALGPRHPTCCEAAAQLIRQEGLRDPRMAEFVARSVAHEAIAGAVVPPERAQAAAETACRIFFDPASGSDGVAARVLMAIE
ncbi:hypothetical protein FNF27_04173 [Cafeteria roenbergensis]|uniref:Uncharacterized protein n=1 Tax=Cafeteria roenbergensis TaxID=33653 RepID=A0A5A8EEL6_CAFRO|nr:hypothetical protein FNF29_04699 [Cafeteria roenbergensis]KAA0159277.1 hypothetical protein FNF28_05912 [Cafeteria roenbergensis]KAA0159448.1 hypothetical protein FNF31_04814 [Cafeteria roenbergensis]KAA0174380.1 hypothetical protein FNF27_04173 [Cafeteria roenbergensis]|eukprot:KAA0151224.1 hypothetical protein FNF29_04699 [Cafeteria roenbergensis]